MPSKIGQSLPLFQFFTRGDPSCCNDGCRPPLPLRNIKDLLFERGIDIWHEAVRDWWKRSGPLFAGDLRRQRVSWMRSFRLWRWHLDEMYVKLNGEIVYLWRPVDLEVEIRPQSLQSRTPSCRSADLQVAPPLRPGGVANRHGLTCKWQGRSYAR